MGLPVVRGDAWYDRFLPRTEALRGLLLLAGDAVTSPSLMMEP